MKVGFAQSPPKRMETCVPWGNHVFRNAILNSWAPRQGQAGQDKKLRLTLKSPTNHNNLTSSAAYGSTFSTSCTGSKSAKRKVMDSDTSRHLSP